MSPSRAFEAPPNAVAGCELCASAGGQLLWSDASWRVVRVEDQAFPAFYRVISRRHVAEFCELSIPERTRCMELVCAVENVLIDRLHPAKVNLAALGNVVPHLHWHVVARFDWDTHFPQPIWGSPQRVLAGSALERLPVSMAALDRAVVEAIDRH